MKYLLLLLVAAPCLITFETSYTKANSTRHLEYSIRNITDPISVFSIKDFRNLNQDVDQVVIPKHKYSGYHKLHSYKNHYYTNVNGQKVQSPTSYSSAPEGATALCRDGTYSFSQNHRGTCSHHGGVQKWLR